MKKKRNLMITIVIILILIMICTLVCVFNKEEDVDGYIPQLPGVNINGDLNYEESRSGGISIPTTQGYNIMHGQTEQELYLANPSTNSCDFIISIYLSDGTMIYKSELLPPGETITKVQLSYSLVSGVYRNCIVIYDCYRHSTGEPITRCEMIVELNCI